MTQSRPSAAFRDFAGEPDWWAIRDLLIRTHRMTPVDWNWNIRHWDGARFHGEDYRQSRPVANGIGLWEAEGQVVGAAHCEDRGDAFFELDPDYRGVQAEMLTWAEQQLATQIDSVRRLQVYVKDYDLTRHALLAQRGYQRTEAGGWLRIVRFGTWAIPEPHLEPMYVMGTTSDASAQADAERMAVLLNASFGRSQHTAAEYIPFMRDSPSFRHDLNLVAMAPDGSFAAHVGVSYDEVNRYGIFEPVCTHPDHRRHGLARALLLEGMHRLRDLGAESACVETGDREPANVLYRAVGFTEEYRGHWWRRDF